MVAETPTRLLHRPDAQPFIWWTSDQLARIRALVLPIWQQWQRDWVPMPSTEDLSVSLAQESTSGSSQAWVHLGASDAAQAWIADTQALNVQNLLFDNEPATGDFLKDSPIAASVVQQASAALKSFLMKTLALDPVPGDMVSTEAFRPWSGAVILRLGSLSVLLNGAAADALVKPDRLKRSGEMRPGLTPIGQAVSPCKVSLRAELAACDLDLGSLASLCIGDIVPIPHGLEEPLRVYTAEGASICEAFLGHLESAKAIELLRAGATSEQLT